MSEGGGGGGGGSKAGVKAGVHGPDASCSLFFLEFLSS